VADLFHRCAGTDADDMSMMSTGGLLMCVPMVALLAWAALIDLRDRRIPNWLTVSLALAGLAQSFSWAHTVPPATAALGFVTGFGITFILFALGALGGGDVKLLAGLGAWLGPTHTLLVFAAAAIIGMVIVLAQAARRGRLKRLFQNSAVIATNLVFVGDGLDSGQAAEMGQACSGGAGSDKPLPYAVPVFVAASVLLLLTSR
jgi:prepilin peptidase CpaA